MLEFRCVVLLASVSLLGPACGGPEVPQAEAPSMTWEAFRASAARDSEGVWIFDGDQAVGSEAELRAYFETYVAATATTRGGLAVYNTQGVSNPSSEYDVKWGAALKMNLTYCVSNTFGANKARVVTAMNAATAAWEATARVNFIYDATLDATCTAAQAGVVFDVRPVNSGGQYLARAFFPNSGRPARNVLIDNTAFGNIAPYTLTGVLRHELGHVLGFVHESNRCPGGGLNWRALTVYDSASVMHYPQAGGQCTGTNAGDLVLTALDKQGARALYP
ncbi:putative lipoprotein [Myxococcus stipitatus DSM 14675]|uniref:Putative lipoprotein n=1 Tax=Myxococcus stipitatus (strain DSM 14675 / JCM 12634 / Mx s8) TaxID=1278073 RepID=L7TZE2_MYXSD|nr:M57 family metalloprotease [Myxococcus stipitatus]AGC41881.1 putative lipoprotein [Myxococcus stipitatus DSM 14675]